MNATIYLLSILFIIGCKQPNPVDKSASLKDSVIRQYFSIVDSLDFYDTTDYSYRILKAYVNDDTLFFKKAKKGFDNLVDYYSFNTLESCIVPKKLSDLPVDEAYRFIHSESFCDFGQTVIISKSIDSIKLYYFEYILPTDAKKVIHKSGKNYVVDSNCTIIKDFSKSLKLEDWQKLKDALYKTDYWGLKPTTPPRFLDPSHWQIDAYTKQPGNLTTQQVYSVKRESPPFKEFADLCMLFMKLSGEKGMCEPFD